MSDSLGAKAIGLVHDGRVHERLRIQGRREFYVKARSHRTYYVTFGAGLGIAADPTCTCIADVPCSHIAACRLLMRQWRDEGDPHTTATVAVTVNGSCPSRETFAAHGWHAEAAMLPDRRRGPKDRAEFDTDDEAREFADRCARGFPEDRVELLRKDGVELVSAGKGRRLGDHVGHASGPHLNDEAQHARDSDPSRGLTTYELDREDARREAAAEARR